MNLCIGMHGVFIRRTAKVGRANRKEAEDH